MIILTLFIFILLSPFNLYAYIPTLESIFRNAANTVSTTSEPKYVKVKMDFHTIEQTTPKYTGSYFMHYLISPGIGLKSIGMGKDGYVKLLPNSWAYGNKNLEIEQRIFFSALESIFLSKGASMVEVLKVYFPSFKKNTDLLNPRKLQFLHKHRKVISEFHQYHEAKRPVPGILNAQLNEIHRSKGLNQENYYLGSQLEYAYDSVLGISLKASLENVDFLFHHQTHRILQIDLLNSQPKMKFIFNQETFMSDVGTKFPKDIDIYEDGVWKWRINIPRMWISGQIPSSLENVNENSLTYPEIIYPELILKL